MNQIKADFIWTNNEILLYLAMYEEGVAIGVSLRRGMWVFLQTSSNSSSNKITIITVVVVAVTTAEVAVVVVAHCKCHYHFWFTV